MAPTSLGDRIKLEPGDFVMVDVMTIHLDATFWGENPERFNPSRQFHFFLKLFCKQISLEFL
jgi:cytochrome P450